MIVPDVNLLLYAFNSGSPHYDAAGVGGRGWSTAQSRLVCPGPSSSALFRLIPVQSI